MHPTQPLQRSLRRLALTTKQAGKDYYKGNRTGSMGWHTKHGGYKIDYKKVRTYVVPEGLANFNVHAIMPEDLKWDADEVAQLSPFVAKRIEPPKGRYESVAKGPLSGERYLERWKAENGED